MNFSWADKNGAACTGSYSEWAALRACLCFKGLSWWRRNRSHASWMLHASGLTPLLAGCRFKTSFLFVLSTSWCVFQKYPKRLVSPGPGVTCGTHSIGFSEEGAILKMGSSSPSVSCSVLVAPSWFIFLTKGFPNLLGIHALVGSSW